MPYLSIETNQAVAPAAQGALMKSASALIAGLLGKPESYVLVTVQPETPLMFGGSGEPAAFVRLKSIGLPADHCPELSEKICHFLTQELGIPPNRVFIDFKDAERGQFGWNGTTF